LDGVPETVTGVHQRVMSRRKTRRPVHHLLNHVVQSRGISHDASWPTEYRSIGRAEERASSRGNTCYSSVIRNSTVRTDVSRLLYTVSQVVHRNTPRRSITELADSVSSREKGRCCCNMYYYSIICNSTVRTYTQLLSRPISQHRRLGTRPRRITVTLQHRRSSAGRVIDE